ncbi:carbonic anhydrase [Mucidula mucida]|nr:carbonic anhydrase [Mucidula mucida]
MLLATFPLLILASSVLAHPVAHINAKASSGSESEESPWDVLYDGHESFIEEMDTEHPGMFEEQTVNGQHPAFVVLACSDSRVAPETVFDTLPGTIFSERSIANQFREDDLNSHSIISYSVEHLDSQHIVVMGHYGCGGVAAAIASPPPEPLNSFDEAIQEWIEPIRELYSSSDREEIVEYREEHSSSESMSSPEILEPAFRALVEENVKQNVLNLAGSDQINEFWGNSTNAPVFIYGLVYDIENGNVFNLNVSMGPPGHEIPDVPFAVMAT